MRALARLLALGVAAAAACGGGHGPGGPSNPSSLASAAPDFTTRDVNGQTFRLSDHLGKEVILLDFWATFCEPCKSEFPRLRAMYDANKARGLVVIGVSMDGPESVAEVPAFVKRYGLDFPIVFDEDSRIAAQYNPKKTMPLSVLIGRDGHIAVVREGYNPGDEKFVEADVARALEGPAPSR
jgi:peroxiredoxin